MGNIIGGIVGGLGSLAGGQSAKSNDLTGYNYLSGQRPGLGQGAIGYANTGNTANNASADLLGINGAAGSARSAPAFQNYLDSTGYGFQLDQGTKALTGNAASRGILNSGSTGKALTNYGQQLAKGSFDNYLGQVGNVAQRGLTATGQIGEAGTSGGKAAGDAMQSGISKAGGAFGSALSLASAFL